MRGIMTITDRESASGRAPTRMLPEGTLQAAQPGLSLQCCRLIAQLIDRAASHRLTLLCAPTGSGKTAACSTWVNAAAMRRRAVWVALESEADQVWLWAGVCSGLRTVAAPEVIYALEDESPSGFPLRLAEVASLFSEPVVVVIDNAHLVTDEVVLAGLGLLIRHAPAGLRLVLSGRWPPRLDLARLRAAGELAEIGPADIF
jgi:LuxR family maltose regulon positive regulatory protein